MSKQSTRTAPQDRGRISARRKTEAVHRLQRGEDLDALSRELGVVVATLSGWRDAFLDGGTDAMRSRPADDRDELVARLRAKVGQPTMGDELLGRKCQLLESGRPLRRGGGASEPLRLPFRRQAIWPPAGLPRLRPGQVHRLIPQGP